MKVDIFAPYEIEIKTGRTKDELIRLFAQRAKMEGNRFYIDSEPYAFLPRSIVEGEITDGSEWTVVSFKICPAPFLKAFSYFWLGSVAIAVLLFAIKSLIRWEYDTGIPWGIAFCFVGFIVTQITFRTSADIQEESIRQMIRSNE